MGVGDEILHVVPDTKRDTEDQDHREAGEDGTRDEIWREDSCVPAWNL